MKKILSLFMAVALLITLFTGVITANAANVEFTDVPANYWAAKYINYLAYKNILVGDGNGKFRPNDTVKRAEFIKMMVELFGLERSVQTQYTNVPKWAVGYIEKAAAQGFLLPYPASTDFNQELTREEASALLMHYLNIDKPGDVKNIIFKDYSEIDAAYRDYVLQAVENGIISGYKEDSTFKPKKILTRAEALTILYLAAGAIFDQSAYSYPEGANKTNSVIKDNSSLYNLTLSGRIIISEGVEAVNFINCTINGEIFVRSGASVTFKGTNAPYIRFIGKNAELNVKENSSIKVADINNTALITIDEKCQIETLNVNENAADTRANGKGAIAKINIYAQNVNTGDILPSEYFIAKGRSAVFAGTTFTEGSGKTNMSGFKSAFVSGSYYYDDQGFVWTTPYTSPDKLRYMINITYVPNVDGSVYAVAWPVTEKTPSARDIYLNYEDYIGEYAVVKAGTPSSFAIEVPANYENYNVCMMIVTKDSTPMAKIVSAVYNQDKIGYSAKSMGTELPEAIELAKPQWNVSISEDSKSIVLMFDQIMYTYKNRKLVSLSSLTNDELKSLFALEINSYKPVTESVDFDIEVYEGYTTLIYITPKDGLENGAYYYTNLKTDLYNAAGLCTNTLINGVYIGKRYPYYW